MRWFVILVFFQIGCIHTEIEPVMPRSDLFHDPAKDAPAVCLLIGPSHLVDEPWIHAMSVSRIFGSSIKNTTGSLKVLIQNSFIELMRRKGYNSKCADSVFTFHVIFEKAALLWYPPQEFIQTPSPRHPGRIKIDFSATYQLKKNDTSEVVQSGSFLRSNVLQTMPGNEKEVLEDQAALLLSELFEQWNGEIAMVGGI